jgi:hypothetical protein
MSFEDTGSRLLALLNNAEAPERAELLRLLDTWSEEYERCEKLDPEDDLQPTTCTCWGRRCACFCTAASRNISICARRWEAPPAACSSTTPAYDRIR